MVNKWLRFYQVELTFSLSINVVDKMLLTSGFQMLLQ